MFRTTTAEWKSEMGSMLFDAFTEDQIVSKDPFFQLAAWPRSRNRRKIKEGRRKRWRRGRGE